MANGPAGKIVGRINIRVAPDTSKFREELRAQLGSINEEVKIKVQLDLDDARAQLAAFGAGASVDVQVRVDTAQARAEIANLDGGTVRVRVVVDDPNVRTVSLDARLSIDMAYWRAQVSRINPVRLDARVDVDQTRISNAVRTAINRGIATANDVDVGADGAFGRGGGGGGGGGGRRRGILGLFANIPTNIVQVLTGSFQALQGIATLNFSTFIGGLQSAVSSILSLVAAIALSGAVASLLVIAGAAITAAWGIVATTISAIPGILATVAIPLGVIALGIDGISKAAQTLAPEFNRLKSVVSTEFEGSFTRAFNTIRPLFKEMEQSVRQVAIAISYFVNVFAMFAVAETTVRNLKATFDNVAQSILSLTQPIGKIVETTLQITALKDAFYPLLAVVQTFGTEYQKSVGDLISDGRLQQALRGLGNVLAEVTRGFVALVENGIRLFAAAAPGIEDFFRSLTDFFNKFDYNRLGTAVGDVFKGIGEALDKIKPETIEKITRAFEDIGKKFRDGNLQQAFANFADAIPSIIVALGQLLDWFGRIGSAAIGFAQLMAGVAETIVRFFQAPELIGDFLDGKISFEDLLKKFGSGADSIGAGLQKIRDAFRTGIQEIDTEALTGFDKVGGTVLNAAIKVANNATTVGDAILAAIRGNKEKIDTALLPGDKDYEEPWKTAVFKVESGIKTGMESAAAIAKSFVKGMGTSIQPGPEAQEAPSFWDRLLQGFGQLFGIRGAANITAATQATKGTETALKPTSGEGGLNSAWTGFLSGVQTAITSGTTGWITSATTGTAGVATATSTGLAGVPAAAQGALAPLGSIISNAFAGVQISVALLGLQVQVAAAMLAIQFTVQTGVTGIQTALQTGFANLGNVTTIAFTLMQVTATVGMLGISTAVVTGFATIIAAFQNGTTQMQSLFTIAMTLIQVSAITGMLAVTLAITSGMAQAVAAVQNGVAQMVAALQAGVAQFTAAGAQMGQGLVNGLLSKLGAVQAAAAQLANAAAAAVAAAAQINSPSRVTTRLGEYFGAGWVRGMNNSRKWIAKSAKGWVDTVTGFLEKVNDPIGKTNISGSVVSTQFAKIDHSMQSSVNDPRFGDRIAECLEGWTVQIDRNGLAKMVNKSNNERKRR